MIALEDGGHLESKQRDLLVSRHYSVPCPEVLGG
jgi:hypothetical protein